MQESGEDARKVSHISSGGKNPHSEQLSSYSEGRLICEKSVEKVKAMDTETEESIIITKLQKQQQSTVRLSRRESKTKRGWTAGREKLEH